ncbi:MAG: C25 family cysteine peptidase [Candidatus Zhuqueibacterota bacterium]
MVALLSPVQHLKSYKSGITDDVKPAVPPEMTTHQIDESRVDFEIRLAGILIEEMPGQPGWQKITLPGYGHISEIGHLMVPQIIRPIAIPASATSEDILIKIKSTAFSSVTDVQLNPVPEMEEKKQTDGSFIIEEKYSPDKALYIEDAFYPENNVSVEKIGFVRDQRVAWLRVCPVQFNPIAREIRVAERIEFTVQLKSGGSITENIFNPATIFFSKRASAQKAGNVSYPVDLLDSRIEVDYLLIAEESFFGNAALDSLAQVRATSSGLDVAVVKTSEIYQQFPDAAHDASIKSFIMYAYNNWQASYFGDGHLGFVLLVGEGNEFSERHVPTHVGPAHSADQWYACLNDDNGDNAVNDYDLTPDIMVGRFSVESPEELNTIVRKTIRYESGLNLNEPWRRKISLISGYIASEVYGEIQSLFEDLNETVSEQDSYYVSDELIRSDDGADFVRTSCFEAFNQGRGIINIQAHGGVDNLGDSHGWLLFQSLDVANLANENRLPVVFSFACHTGEFFDLNVDCLGEALLNTANEGAVFFLGCTHSVNYFVNDRLNRRLFEILFSRQIGCLGLALYYANIFEYPFSTYNILGDPALSLTKNEVEPMVDLSVASSDIRIFWSSTEGNVEMISAEIYNVGFRDVKDVLVQFFNGDPDSGGIKIQGDMVLENIPGQGGHAAALVEIGELYEEELTVYVIVDPYNSVQEIEEGNNRASVYSIVYPFIDVAEDAVPQMAGIGYSTAFGDYNNNGFPDIFVVSKNGNALFQNSNGDLFADVSHSAGIHDSYNVNSSTFLDFDNDGDLDIALNMLSYKPDDLFYIDTIFYENDGQRHFSIRIPYTSEGLPLKAEPIACFDFDNNGLLDFLCSENNGEACFLFKNLGDGRFADVTQIVVPILEEGGKHASVSDYNSDGFPDVYVLRSSSDSNLLLMNNRDGTFTDVADEAGVSSPKGADWSVFGDYNNDGWSDLFIYHPTGLNALYRSNGDGSFENAANIANVAEIKAGFTNGTFLDYDNDGYQDLLLKFEVFDLYKNNRDGTFSKDFIKPSGFSFSSIAVADYDRNGGVDVFCLGTTGIPNALFKNRLKMNNWLTVHLKGITCNSSGIGARIRVVAGGLNQIRDVVNQFAGGLQCDLPVEFGLGNHSVVDTLEVRWPDGKSDILTGVKANAAITVEQGRGDAAIPSSSYLRQNFPNPFNQLTMIQYQVQGNPLSPEKTVAVNLSVYNIVGQKVKTLVNENRIVGSYGALWDGKDELGNYAPSGLYFYNLRSGDFTETKKMLLLR